MEELADRRYGYRPPGAIDFTYLLPLHELIATARGMSLASDQRLYSPTVWEEYNRTIGVFGNEFNVLMEAPEEALEELVSEKLANLIVKLRRNEVEIVPGFDGTYGKIIAKEEAGEEPEVSEGTERKGFEDFL